MARGEADSLISKLRQMSEEGVSSFFTELMANEGLRRRFGRAGENFLNNKRSFDRNVESVLDFVNLPSKRDFRELKARLDHLNGQLTNLNIKIDRLMAGVGSSPVGVPTTPRPRKRPKP
jgi:hypothetical protein